MIDVSRVSLLVLASGLSQRFGTADKLLAPLNGRPLGDYAAETLGRIGYRDHVAVTHDPAVAAIFAARGFRVVDNPAPERGQGSSLAAGLAALGDAEAIMVCLGDMPFVTPGLLQGLCIRFDVERGADVVASASGERRGPPALFAASRLRGLDLSGDEGARPLLKGAAAVVGRSRELADLDTAEDFAKWQR
jgi:molybdenum cofactor cytidylyltransferase